MWHPGTWFTGEQGGAGLTAGIHDLSGLFQPLWFSEFKSIIAIQGGLSLQLGVPTLPRAGGKLPWCCPEPALP